MASNKMISGFSGKPKTDAFYKAIGAYVMSLGKLKKTICALVSYGVNQKFLWMWVYEKTGDGTLYFNVTLDHQDENENYHNVDLVIPNRWNHHVIVKSLETVQSEWLFALIDKGFAFASQ